MIRDIYGGSLKKVGYKGQLQPVPDPVLFACGKGGRGVGTGSRQSRAAACKARAITGRVPGVQAAGHGLRVQKVATGGGASLGNLGRGEAFPAEADGWVQGV